MRSALSVPLDDCTRHFGPHVAAAGLRIWASDGLRFLVGTPADERGFHITAPVDPNWAYGDERAAFTLLADRLDRTLRTA